MRLNKLFWDDLYDLDVVEQALIKPGQIVLGASDTVIGLLSVVSRQGFDTLNIIKGRAEKPYIILVNDKEKINKFTSLQAESKLERLMNHCWPGPVTFIIKAKEDIPDFIKSSEGNIAIRVPAHTGLLKLLERFDGLFSTSANKTGHPIPHCLDEVDPAIISAVSHVVLDREKKGILLPSTILDATGTTIKVVREGAYSIKQLEQLYGKSFEK